MVEDWETAPFKDSRLAGTREREVLRAAQLYFLDGLTQAAIAERMGCTRWTVGRFLKEGVESGMIETRLLHPRARQPHLESALEEKLGVSDAEVVPTQESEEATLALVAQTAADYLLDLRPRPKLVGLGWGRATSAVAKAIEETWGVTGSRLKMASTPHVLSDVTSAGTVRLLTPQEDGYARARAGSNPLAPEVSKPKLKADELTAFSMVESADVMIFSPGSIRESSNLVRSGVLSVHQLRELYQRGARASVLCNFVTETGEVLPKELTMQLPAVSEGALRKFRYSIAIGAGEERIPALAATLRAGLANVVITDSDTAKALLA
ncbi:sugar-binding transcriptional regulator [Actinomyces minihominis]|uniref:sugar-binding transcriptional regulator n=1 Tax=Actinomyces minihominis TaxID=2002838 RepID=UPI000C06BD12|nr:sugar-binding domain-containing protein [Actinomyces minihominis]